MEEKTSGIVISSVNYGESDKIVNVLTPDKGVVSAKMKSVKKAGAKLRFASEPFCFSEYVFSIGKVGRTVIGASLIDSFYPVRLDVKKLYAGSAVLSFTKKFCRENIDSSEIFIYALDALKGMAYGDKSEITYLTEFLCKALADSGYALDVDGCHECGCDIDGAVYFDYRTGGFYCEKCNDGKGRLVLKSTLDALKNASLGMDSQEENAVKGLKLLDYYMENRADVVIPPLKELIKIYT